MIRLLLYSQDNRLPLMLGPTLGSEFEVALESNPEKVKEQARNQRYHVIVLDIDSGSPEHQRDFVGEMHSARVPVVVMADDDHREVAMDLVQRGAYDYFRKPPCLAELKIVARRAYEHSRMGRDLHNLSQQLRATATYGCDQLIGSSARLRHVYDLIQRVTGLNAFVLITGETGTGKELIARAIHNLSERQTCPFVAVSCGAIPETLIEAELFGYEKGAFTGAVGSRKGYLEQAGQGTLFLDEIGELSPHTQVKLLRVLQERQFCRLGSSSAIPLHARVLFATHRNLGKMVEDGHFRLDLYYRVNVMGIKAPSLRDHSEDIPTLARHFLEKYSDLYRKPVTSIAPAAMALLVDYIWPGNVRELENVIQKAIILTDDDTIGPAQLPDDLQQSGLLGLGDALPATSFEDQLHDYKVKLAQKAVAECNGNKTLAARSLHISRTYLHRLIKDFMEEETPEVA
jgi:DNA-binding NtrC family response regulator